MTGAAGGIGRAAALAFAREGASVVVADTSEQNVRETAPIIEESGGRALAVGCDVRQTEDVKAALDKTVDAFGRLDVAFNNAGVENESTATSSSTTTATPHAITASCGSASSTAGWTRSGAGAATSA